MRKKKVAVLISGNGSNLQSLIDASRDPNYPAKITLVISNKADAYGLKRAELAGIDTHVILHEDFETRGGFEAELLQLLVEEDIELICLAGFMRVLGKGFVRNWENKILNIHPSLLPKHKGLNTHARAIKSGDRQAGCTVHYVVPELDAGPIIAQSSVLISPDDTPETLANRVLIEEHKIYPKALRDVALGLK